MGAVERRAEDLIGTHGAHAPTVVALELGTALSAADWDAAAIAAAVRREVRRLLRSRVRA